jgi:predicted RNA-binding Zn-ribbon protein involved in translation (DUF1610 family)
MFCPKCGAVLEEGAKFCSSCGAVIEKVKEIGVRKRFCPNCGAELRESANFCDSCGTRVGELDIGRADEEKYPVYPHLVATICGYIFAFLGGWIGIVFGIYLLTRRHPTAKLHGGIVLAITVVMIIIWIIIAISLGS